MKKNAETVMGQSTDQQSNIKSTTAENIRKLKIYLKNDQKRICKI